MESARWDCACRNDAKCGGDDEGNKEQDSDEWGVDDGDEEHTRKPDEPNKEE